MEENLDLVLLDQLYSARKTQKLIRKVKNLLKHDHEVERVEYQNYLRIQYFESMILDKELLTKKINIKRQKPVDILAKSSIYETWRLAIMISVISYKAIMYNVNEYWSFYKKDKNDKDSKNIR